MARLSAHGTVVGTVEYVYSKKCYMSDGVILANFGHGWKVHSKMKELTPRQSYDRAAANLQRRIITNPAYAVYREAMLVATSFGKRWRLAYAIKIMPNDPDGVWASVRDDGFESIELDVDEIAELCRLYENALKEQKIKSGHPGQQA